MKNLISLYTVYHKHSHIIKNNHIKPIQVGNGKNIEGIDYRDDIGIEITNKNSSYCELTAQYWAWKNDINSDYIGIMHYRRFFDFNVNENRSLNKYGVLEEKEFTLNFIDKYGLSEQSIQKQVVGYDIVLPFEWDVKEIGQRNIKEHYIHSPYHNKKDLDTTRAVLEELYPSYLNIFDEVMSSSKGFFTNMFILRKDLFSEYSEWLFEILHKVEEKTDISSYNTQERRVFGYLSERLFTVWVKYKLSTIPSLKINFLRRVFVANTISKQFLATKPKFKENLISIAIASDDNYTPHLAALIKSIQENLNAKKHLDFIILDGGIETHNKQMLTKLVTSEHSIQFLTLASEFEELTVHMHFSRATFYRLILDKLVPNRERLLYIDCDTIVLDDVAKLYDTNLEGKAIGAVFDYIMHHFCQVGVRSIDFTGSMKSKEYLESYVGLNDKWSGYFQAGVILFDLEKLRKLNLSKIMIKDLIDKRYWFLDQDILNKYFLDNVKYLDPKWNVVNVNADIYEGLPDNYIEEIKIATLSPSIIHYAGYDAKPWNNKNAKFSEYYFYYLRKTFWYENVFLAISSHKSQKNKYKNETAKSLIWKISYKVWLKLPYFLQKRLTRIKEYLKVRL